MKRTGYHLAAALALLVAGCASGGPDDGLGVRKLSWFSYLNADDLRGQCKAGSPERLRLVLNADYAEHVRTYDLTVDDKTGGGEMVIRVMKAASLTDLTSSGSLLDPWRGVRKTVSLPPKHTAALLGRITRSGAFASPPVGLSLSSTEFYWLVSGCHLGQAFVTAYRLSGKGASEPAFVTALEALDTSGVAFPDAAARDLQLSRMPPHSAQEISLTFTIRIGDNGLRGMLPPL